MTKKIAFPTNDNLHVEEHFGHCKTFAIFTLEDGKKVEESSVPAPKHEPGVLPKFLANQGANIIITGGMGQKAINLFEKENIEVILGAKGTIEENLQAFNEKSLKSSGSACSHTHDENHTCNH